ncbi:MAG: phosphate ABC transporter permease subunit PstC [Chloroflexi bacterium]|nr:phosphate ABC transporter permease subunit PstC [Chloroflexota bacterium]
MLDRALVAAGWIGAVLPTVALLLIIVFLVHSAFPSVLYNGLHFLTGTEWNLGNLYVSTTTVRNGVKAAQGASYGALPLVLGTLLSSIIALVIGVPIAVASALVIVERLPRSWNVPFSVALELLAGFPSVVYGLWGLIVLGPFLAHYTYPTLARVLGFIPFLGGQTGSGLGLLTSGIVLAVMIIPIVAATTRDLLTQVPPPTREGALALGFTGWETARLVSLPWIRAGIFGACILGWARALGETMAVLMVSGSAANTIPSNIYGPVSTIAATIVALLDSALTDPTGLAQSALAEAGLLLFLITFGSNILARVILRRAGGTALPVGRGI